jgi:hypothetical protein
MAAGAFTLYNFPKKYFFDGTMDYDTWGDVSAQELVTGTQADYAAQAMTGEAVNGGTATATAVCDAGNVSFGTNVSLTARYAVIRVGTATPGASDNIVGYVELNTTADVSSTNGTFEIQWHANGLWTVS